MPMKRFSQYSDLILILILCLLFIAQGIFSYFQWQGSHQDWNTNFEKSSINLNELHGTGQEADSLMVPIDRPNFVAVARAMSWLDGRSPVLVLAQARDARAYPLTVLLVHGLVNDNFDGKAIAVTFNPLCNSPVVYLREMNGYSFRMGITGQLYGNNLLMYDSLTESWWLQSTGEAVVGDYTGTVLEVLPSQTVAFNSFAQNYPSGKVLAGDENFPEQTYSVNPYLNYAQGPSPLMGDSNYDPRLPVMELIIGMEGEGSAIAYAFSLLQSDSVINDRFNDQHVVVFWQPGAANILDEFSIAQSRDMGQAAIFDRFITGRELHFYVEANRIFDEETDSEWNIFGEAIDGPLEGSQLEPFVSFSQFWFSWSLDHPETAVYQRPGR
jgi:hypothetical protein